MLLFFQQTVYQNKNAQSAALVCTFCLHMVQRYAKIPNLLFNFFLAVSLEAGGSSFAAPVMQTLAKSFTEDRTHTFTFDYTVSDSDRGISWLSAQTKHVACSLAKLIFIYFLRLRL